VFPVGTRAGWGARSAAEGRACFRAVDGRKTWSCGGAEELALRRGEIRVRVSPPSPGPGRLLGTGGGGGDRGERYGFGRRVRPAFRGSGAEPAGRNPRWSSQDPYVVA